MIVVGNLGNELKIKGKTKKKKLTVKLYKSFIIKLYRNRINQKSMYSYWNLQDI